jgi:uncharacterized protein YaaQ
MKLIYAIVSNDDSHTVTDQLMKSGFMATKLATTGGFLLAGNTTLMICTNDEKVDEVIEIISKWCKKRKTVSNLNQNYGVGTFSSIPVEIVVGGATVFVTNVERFEKI